MQRTDDLKVFSDFYELKQNFDKLEKNFNELVVPKDQEYYLLREEVKKLHKVIDDFHTNLPYTI